MTHYFLAQLCSSFTQFIGGKLMFNIPVVYAFMIVYGIYT